MAAKIYVSEKELLEIYKRGFNIKILSTLSICRLCQPVDPVNLIDPVDLSTMPTCWLCILVDSVNLSSSPYPFQAVYEKGQEYA